MYPTIRKSHKLREKLDSYEIEHLSASALNEYINDPAKWVMKYILKIKTTGPAMWRGNAIECAMKNIILATYSGLEYTLEDAIAFGIRVFEQEEQIWLTSRDGEVSENYSEKREKEFEFIEPSIRAGFDFFKAIPQASFQKRFDFDLGIEVRAIGYIDFYLDGVGIVELKTSKQIPTELKDSVRRQVALQCMATNSDARIVYLSRPTKNKSHEGIKIFEIKHEEAKRLVDDYRMAARSIRRLLMNTSTVEEIIEFVFPNYDSFLWDEEEKEIARKIWTFGKVA
ncbi:PD-(D/E)XK nuclease family protein [Leptospira kirschneri str. 200801774]|uniref:PD-(D/E)XK nuclease family protein n=1 Tax=Leptospira kirschneri TaxID=29507 RepID=UPI0002BDD154|nr:PD-(D/E)XK nuclease family protein [Leptospira kirschneri]EMO78573.1 PD-(D/E)XK nuclease family protein [Leptospira kirschneri str. 200801774]